MFDGIVARYGNLLHIPKQHVDSRHNHTLEGGTGAKNNWPQLTIWIGVNYNMV